MCPWVPSTVLSNLNEKVESTRELSKQKTGKSIRTCAKLRVALIRAVNAMMDVIAHQVVIDAGIFRALKAIMTTILSAVPAKNIPNSKLSFYWSNHIFAMSWSIWIFCLFSIFCEHYQGLIVGLSDKDADTPQTQKKKNIQRKSITTRYSII